MKWFVLLFQTGGDASDGSNGGGGGGGRVCVLCSCGWFG